MSDLYAKWCRTHHTADGKKTLWLLAEVEGGREFALEEVPRRILRHYTSKEEIAAVLDVLEYPETAEFVRTLLPEELTVRSGDLGEILATEFVEERLGYDVPIRRLRSKDHRDMPMRGEDVIGAAIDDDDRLTLLKGEAKSAQALSRTTVAAAREKLQAEHGRPSAHGLIFVGRQLITSEDPDRKNLGTEILRAATGRGIPKRRVSHLLFTFTGNGVEEFVEADLDAADGDREQHSANLRIPDHREFIVGVYGVVSEEAGTLGDD